MRSPWLRQPGGSVLPVLGRGGNSVWETASLAVGKQVAARRVQGGRGGLFFARAAELKFGRLLNNRQLLLTALEAGHPRLGWQHSQVLVRPLLDYGQLLPGYSYHG